MKFEIIDVDKSGLFKILKPSDCIDYQSDENQFDFIGKNKKILLRLKSTRIAHAHNVGIDVYYGSK